MSKMNRVFNFNFKDAPSKQIKDFIEMRKHTLKEIFDRFEVKDQEMFFYPSNTGCGTSWRYYHPDVGLYAESISRCVSSDVIDEVVKRSVKDWETDEETVRKSLVIRYSRNDAYIPNFKRGITYKASDGEVYDIIAVVRALSILEVMGNQLLAISTHFLTKTHPKKAKVKLDPKELALDVYLSVELTDNIKAIESVKFEIEDEIKRKKFDTHDDHVRAMSHQYIASNILATDEVYYLNHEEEEKRDDDWELLLSHACALVGDPLNIAKDNFLWSL